MDEEGYRRDVYGPTLKAATPLADSSLAASPSFDDPAFVDHLLEDQEPRPFHPPSRGRVLTVASIAIAVLLLATLPPLLNVNRFRRQIASSISQSLGRPVHLDSVTLNLLPEPGFTLQNFVVGEDPDFGSEPVIFANTVTVRLRVRSLWRRRVEFSRIELDSPSVNLVHLPDGRWNVESILLQASRMPAAPTAQKSAGDAPRFPYIEATGARLNIKQGLEKMPLSLTDAKFALWLPEPRQWRLRLDAHPSRTDAAPMDTGLLHLEGTLGKAPTLAAVPLDLSGEWSAAPLGAVSWVLLGRDAGLRGELDLKAHVRGTVGTNGVEANLQLKHARREEFVPARTLDVDLRCTAQPRALFHRLEAVHCSWPADTAGSGLIVDATIPDVFHPQTAAGVARVRNLPASLLLDALRAASPRVAPALSLAGTLNAELYANPQPESPHQEAGSSFSGDFVLGDARLALGDTSPFFQGSLPGRIDENSVAAGPASLALYSAPPATLNLTADPGGYRFHLEGNILRSRLMELAVALPQFGDGLEGALPPATYLSSSAETPVRVDLSSARLWRGPQVWASAPAPKPRPIPAPRRRRR